ncbi:hypothetical protein AGMMS50249_5190 [candidate division SR1 bacterium]|nr:hypothetical protein AGMMS50249_5190 [candidate division SR1 bacterium]
MSDNILTKYADILREEINVKEITDFSSDQPIVKVFKPLGGQLSAKFGKDTGQIISNGKQGNVRELTGGDIEIFSPSGEKRVLSDGDYEIVYEGLDGDDIAVEGNVIVKLDLNLTEELRREGIAREISRFLNQMRKDADFPVDARVSMIYSSTDVKLLGIMQDFSSFFMDEALLSSVNQGDVSGDIVSEFSSDDQLILFSLRK